MSKPYSLIFTLLIPFLFALGQETDEGSEYGERLKTMFEVSGADKTYQAAIDQMFGMFKQQYDQVPTNTWTQLQDEFSKTSISELTLKLTPVYQTHLSLTDIQEIIEFYQTPVGKKFASKTPFIVQESMQVGQQWGQQIGKKFAQKMKEKGY